MQLGGSKGEGAKVLESSVCDSPGGAVRGRRDEAREEAAREHWPREATRFGGEGRDKGVDVEVGSTKGCVDEVQRSLSESGDWGAVRMWQLVKGDLERGRHMVGSFRFRVLYCW